MSERVRQIKREKSSKLSKKIGRKNIKKLRKIWLKMFIEKLEGL